MAPASILLSFERSPRLRSEIRYQYPVNEQNVLLKLLQAGSYPVAVLTDHPERYECPTFPNGSLEKLERLLSACSVFVGLELFPARCIVSLMRHPELCMLARTEPVDWIPAREVFRAIQKASSI